MYRRFSARWEHSIDGIEYTWCVFFKSMSSTTAKYLKHGASLIEEDIFPIVLLLKAIDRTNVAEQASINVAEQASISKYTLESYSEEELHT